MMNLCDVTNKHKRSSTSDNETSSKLWHYHLYHILRERIGHLIKVEILQSLDFSDLEHCIDCINGNFIKHIKKDGATHRTGVL
jgi:hypothetical protein